MGYGAIEFKYLGFLGDNEAWIRFFEASPPAGWSDF